MKKFITACFLLICSFGYSQQHPTEHTKCQMTVNDILHKQSFDIDAPISEKARYVFFDIYDQLNHIYKTEEGSQERAKHIEGLNEALQNANALDLNISMFEEDLKIISKMNH